MKDPRNRCSLRLQMSDTKEAYDAATVIALWKKARQATQHTIRAIRMYAALLAGDDSLLRMYFPFVASAGVGYAPRPPSRTPSDELVIELEAKSETDDLSDFMEMF